MIIFPTQVKGAIITMDHTTLRRIHANTTRVRIMLPATLSIQLKKSRTTKSNNIEIDESCPHSHSSREYPTSIGCHKSIAAR